MDKYGVKLFEELVDSLWARRKLLLKEAKKDPDVDGWFGYPDYWGIPKRVKIQLGSEAVDRIQWITDMTFDCQITKAQFKKDLRHSLFLLAY